jgi:hypothetical protein
VGFRRNCGAPGHDQLNSLNETQNVRRFIQAFSPSPVESSIAVTTYGHMPRYGHFPAPPLLPSLFGEQVGSTEVTLARLMLLKKGVAKSCVG